jgi:hypothetical protein
MAYLNIMFKVLLIVASLVYIVTDLFFIITNTIPSNFILIENFIYALAYFLLFLGLIKSDKRNLIVLLTLIIVSFNAGRVSESIIDSLGRIPPLALSHVPLSVGLIILMIIAFLNKE